MAAREISIRLSVEDADRTRQVLESVGATGQQALGAVEAAAERTGASFGRLHQTVEPALGAVGAAATRTADSIGRMHQSVEPAFSAMAAGATRGAASFERLQRSLDPAYASSARFAAQQDQLNRAVASGLVSQERANALLDLARQRYEATGRAAEQAGAAAARGFGGVGGVATQAGYQLQDFAGQVAAGTSAITAFGQQAPQFLGIFGAGGAIAGAAIAVGAVAAKFLLTGDSAEDAAKRAEAEFRGVAEGQKDLGKAIDDVNKLYMTQEERAQAAARAAREATGSILAMSEDKLLQRNEGNVIELADARKKLAEAEAGIARRQAETFARTGSRVSDADRGAEAALFPLRAAVQGVEADMSRVSTRLGEVAAARDKLATIKYDAPIGPDAPDKPARAAAGRTAPADRSAEREFNDALRDREALIQANETAYEKYQRRLEEIATLQDRAATAGAPLDTETIRRATDRALADYEKAAEAGATKRDEAATRQAERDETRRQASFDRTVERYSADLSRGTVDALFDGTKKGEGFFKRLANVFTSSLRTGAASALDALVMRPLLSGGLQSLGFNGSNAGGSLLSMAGGGGAGGGGFGSLFSGVGSLFGGGNAGGTAGLASATNAAIGASGTYGPATPQQVAAQPGGGGLDLGSVASLGRSGSSLFGGGDNGLGLGGASSLQGTGVAGFLNTPLSSSAMAAQTTATNTALGGMGTVGGQAVMGPATPAAVEAAGGSAAGVGTIGGAIGGVGAGFGAGMLTSSVVGGARGGAVGPGGAIGAGVGSVAGFLVGGPIGAMVGGAIGGAVGAMFGPTKKGMADRAGGVVIYNVVDGQLGVTGTTGKRWDEAGSRAEIQGQLDAINKGVADRGMTFGGTLGGGGQVGFGKAASDRPQSINEADIVGLLRSDNANVTTALATLTAQRKGLADAFRAADFVTQVYEPLLASGDAAAAFQAQIQKVNDQFRDATDQAAALGLATDGLTAARDKELRRMQEQQDAPAKALLEQLTFGGGAGLSAEARGFAALSSLNAAQAGARSGDTSLAEFSRTAQATLPVLKEFFGTSERYGALVGEVAATLRGMAPTADTAGLATLLEAQVTGTDAVTNAVLAIGGDTNDLLGRMLTEFSTLRGQIEALARRVAA